MTMRRSYQPSLGILPRARPVLVVLGVAIAAVMFGRIAVTRSSASGAVPPPLNSGARVSPDLAERAEQAVAIVIRAQDFIRSARQADGVAAGPEAQPDPSGMIGNELTPLMTTLGSLEAKRISTNPEWARALTVRMSRAGVQRGTVVAAGFSGSFPALNLATIAACEALEADLVAVSSVTASSWGANQAGFTWPEMEARLVRAGIIRRATIAVSAGGSGDRARDLEPEGRALAEQIQQQAASDLEAVSLRPEDLSASIQQRLDLYRRAAGGRPVVLYVNVGGTEASLGESAAVLRLRSGFIPGVPFDFSLSRGLVARFAERGVPVLTLLNVRDLAVRWGVALESRQTDR
jgi:poly-gamma-glutamate system protein